MVVLHFRCNFVVVVQGGELCLPVPPSHTSDVMFSVEISLLLVLILVICVLYIFLLIRFARGLSVTISSKNTFLALLIFCIVCFSISWISVVPLLCSSSYLF